MKFIVYTVYTYGESGEELAYLSIHKHKAIAWAEDYHERTEYDVWIEYEEIDLADFEICSYGCYSPKNIIWERKIRD